MKGTITSITEKKTEAPTANIKTGPGSAFREAPAQVTGRPRRTQKLFSVSVKRTHRFGRAQMNQSQVTLARMQMTPTQNESQ
jgi:hypothetical protein